MIVKSSIFQYDTLCKRIHNLFLRLPDRPPSLRWVEHSQQCRNGNIWVYSQSQKLSQWTELHIVPDWLCNFLKPIMNQVSLLTQFLIMTSMHKFPPQRASTASSPSVSMSWSTFSTSTTSAPATPLSSRQRAIRAGNFWVYILEFWKTAWNLN